MPISRSASRAAASAALAFLVFGCGDSDSGQVKGDPAVETVLAELRDSRDLLLEVLEDTVQLAEEETAPETIASGHETGDRTLSVLPVVAAPPQPPAWPAGIPLLPTISNVDYPASCTDDDPATPCVQDSALELAMERKFWAIVQNTAIEDMKSWTSSSVAYATASESLYRARIFKLAAFGNTMIYTTYAPGDPAGLRYIISGASDIVRSIRLNVYNPNALAMGLYYLALTEFLLEPRVHSPRIDGEGVLDKMLKIALLFGRPSPKYNVGYGSELRYVGLSGHTSLLNSPQDPIQFGINGFNDGQNWSVVRTTSLAPFKQVGAEINLAEAYAALDQREASEERYARIEEWLVGKNAPAGYGEWIEATRVELLGASGLIETWQTPRGLLESQIRQPYGPFEQTQICRMCHLGAVVPDDYYSWRTPSEAP